jgi:hypothetical protein
MSKVFICNGEKYTFGSETISLPVVLKDLPKEINVEGYKLLLRSSFHISLVCIGKITEKHNISIPDFEKLVIADFCEFAAEKDISLVKLRDEFSFVESGEKRSVVIFCDVSNLSDFFGIINRKYGLHLETQPTHVTLYTLQPDVGIFLTDFNDIDQLTKPIENPIGFMPQPL